MRKSGGFFVFGGVLGVLLSGCALESPLSVRRVWADYNTLKTPAIYYDKISHLPPDSVRVKEMQWMYNKGPHELGRYSLIPDPEGSTPVPGPPSLIKPPPTNVAPPVPLPKSLNGDSLTPPVPPMPGEMKTPTTSGPVADRSLVPERTARQNVEWRFIQ